MKGCRYLPALLVIRLCVRGPRKVKRNSERLRFIPILRNMIECKEKLRRPSHRQQGIWLTVHAESEMA